MYLLTNISNAFGLSAEIERELISLRTKEAIMHMKELGKPVGRPLGVKNKTHKIDVYAKKVQSLLAADTPKRHIARQIKVSVPTLYEFLNSIKQVLKCFFSSYKRKSRHCLLKAVKNEDICPFGRDNERRFFAPKVFGDRQR